MELEIFSLIDGFPILPGPLERSSTVNKNMLREPKRDSKSRLESNISES